LSQADVEGIAEGGAASASSVNRQSTLKMEADEALGSGATISSVLYANVNHPEWKKEFPGKLSNSTFRSLEKLLVIASDGT
jgi:histone-lysine N-methyltransferase MLL3